MQTKQQRIYELKGWVAFYDNKDIQTEADRAEIDRLRREIHRLEDEIAAEGDAA